MKNIIGLISLPLLALSAVGFHLDGSLYGALPGAMSSPLSPLALTSNMAAVSPLASLAHMAPMVPLESMAVASPLGSMVSSIDAASSIAPMPFMLPQSYPSPYDLSMPYGPQLMPPPSPFAPGCPQQYPSPYTSPYMSPGSPFMPNHPASYGSQMLPFMPPPPPFMPQFPAPYGSPCMNPSPFMPPPHHASYPGVDMSVVSPLMAFTSDDPYATAMATNYKAVPAISASTYALM